MRTGLPDQIPALRMRGFIERKFLNGGAWTLCVVKELKERSKERGHFFLKQATEVNLKDGSFTWNSKGTLAGCDASPMGRKSAFFTPFLFGNRSVIAYSLI